MKKLALIALSMVLGLSGCACPGTSSSIRQDWAAYWRNPGGESWESIKKDWAAYWRNPAGENWESIKWDWVAYWKNPGGGTWELLKQDWTFWRLNKACLE
jgi:hypothetical protein